MSEITLLAYLYFPGNCRQAMEFYKEVFGGQLSLQTFGEVPSEALPGGSNDDNKDLIMHARLEGDITLFASDGSRASDHAAKVDLSLNGSDESRLREIFMTLSRDGQVHQPLQTMFWGDIFGSLTDQFGVNWMVNIQADDGQTT